MARSNVRCSMGHTALFPGKNEVRTSTFEKADNRGGLITISHGALDILNAMRWKGPIQVCDRDPGVCERMDYIIEDKKYPRLNLLPVAYCRDAIWTLAHWIDTYGEKGLSLIDLDLTESIVKVWQKVCKDIITLLWFRGIRTKVFITFRNGRDNFGKGSISKRVDWLQEQVPKGVKVVSHQCYRSDWIGQFATGELGSSMCIVELHT